MAECVVYGLKKFKDYFKGYEDQYVLIGGTACDIAFEEREQVFRKTRDLDMVLIFEVLTSEFGDRFWEFVKGGKYRNKVTNKGKSQFYRFDKPEIDGYPRMIESFCREDFKLKENKGITPIHIDDFISTLFSYPFDYNLLKERNLKNEEVIDKLKSIYG